MLVKSGRRFGNWDCCVCFEQFGRLGTGLLFEMMCCPYKNSTLFLFLIWLETKLSIVDGPSTLVEFIDWVGCK